eukprot:2089758-Rhodomonas_salina.1
MSATLPMVLPHPKAATITGRISLSLPASRYTPPNRTHACFVPDQMEKQSEEETIGMSDDNDKSVRVVPRRKAEEPRRRRDEKNDALVLRKDLLLKFANVPLPKAAKVL